MKTIDTIVLLASALAVSFAIGKGADDVTKVEVKSLTANWLKGKSFDADYLIFFHNVLRLVFNNIFSENVTSKQFIIRSFITSCVGVGVVFFLIHILQYLQFVSPKYPQNPLIFIMGILLAVLASWCADYASLAKSALIINSKYFKDNITKHFLLDVFLSLIIAAGWIILIAAGIKTTVDYPNQQSEFFSLPAFMSFALITALFPTILTFSFVISAIFARFLVYTGKPLQFIKINVLDIDSKPFSAIAILSWPILIPVVLFISYAIG